MQLIPRFHRPQPADISSDAMVHQELLPGWKGKQETEMSQFLEDDANPGLRKGSH
jgi:hypothetical protein